MAGKLILSVLALLLTAACSKEAPRKFVGQGCVEDPAHAIIEVRLVDMEMATSVVTGTEALEPLTDELMSTTLAETYDGNDCYMDYFVTGTAGSGTSTQVAESLVDFRASGGDPVIGAVFDSRTNDAILTWGGDWMSHSERCTPLDPLIGAHATYEPVADPESFASVCATAWQCSMDGLNSWGSTWADLGTGPWTDRTFEEIWDVASRTEVANAFAACGHYDVTWVGLGPVGGAYAGDTSRIKVVFVLAGHADATVLD